MSNWSNLCPDLLRSILEGLSSPKDFHRARTVCTNWYTVSTTCKRTIHPWKLVFKKFSTLIFDHNDHMIHQFEHPNLNFSHQYCIASFSNWLLIMDLRLNFILLNVFTRETIQLPSLEFLFPGFEPNEEYHNIRRHDLKSAVLWVNDRTGDYVVAWVYKHNILFSYKKGDEKWRRNLDDQGIECEVMGFKDKKLYVFTLDNIIKVFDFSGDVPREDVQSPYHNHEFSLDIGGLRENSWKRRVMITESGDVMAILSTRGYDDKDKYYFRIFKIDVESKKCKRVESIGDEIVLFGPGITVRSTCVNGAPRGSVFFVEDDLWIEQTNYGVFDMGTSGITWANPVGDMRNDTRRWFVPGHA